LIGSHEALEKESAAYYADYLKKTVRVELPDAQLQAAYDWSRVSLLQGLVVNPTMGTGLVAGYRTSGESQRPGFAWFFGRDAFWSTLALNGEGDFLNAKTALAFVAQFQREDGKIPHEIAQGASFVNWFKDYPYGFASADATPLFVIAVGDYVKASGDIEFAKTNWEKLWKAYEFMRSTYAGGTPKNLGIGHGWVEGGPLLPVKSEFYQSGLAVEAQSDLAHLAKLAGKDDVAKTLAEQSENERKALNATFWSDEKKMYAFALDNENKRVDEASVLATVPMWFGLLDEEKASAMISILAGHEHETDWGMRIISNRSAKYGGGGYHYGSVWPLFTGWASVGEYRYHRARPAYDNLRANALLGIDGSPGHVTEVLSGDYYQPLSTASPHQIWSAAMVISPVLRGMMGLQVNVQEKAITLAPHLPAHWSHVGLENVPLGKSSIRFEYKKNHEEITLEVERVGGNESCFVDFQPAVSLRAKVLKAELNGKPVPFKSEPSASDQHIAVRIPISGAKSTLRIFLVNDFELSADATLPPLGSASEGMRIVTERWSASRDQVDLDISGLAGARYKVHVWNAKQIDHVEGAELNSTSRNTDDFLWIEMPKSDAERYSQRLVVIHFGGKAPSKQ
jgi:glycogen debranching enzyme